MLSLRAKAKLKKQIFLVRISIQKRVGGRIFFLLFQTFFYYFQLNAFFTHYYPFPVGVLRSNINKMKRQILIIN